MGSETNEDGDIYWRNQFGKDGPAIFYGDGSISWWIKGLAMTFGEFQIAAKLTKDEITMLILKYGKR